MAAGVGGVLAGNRVLTVATQATVISNRRSGESRNPGNPLEKSEPVTEGSEFRLSPERRVEIAYPCSLTD